MSISRVKKFALALAIMGGVGLAGLNEASAAYSSYCGNGTQYWNSGGYAYKAVYQYSGTPSGGQQPKMYDIYKASQMSGWWKIADDEQHSCPL
ncbi:hypothetical protein [Enhygromyxa salina]|uniref:Uncharacterized protein n=1 Tax=Enhygromyxa salina TaxID=215803 RepID=A0A2S9XTS9_9BACT|nr:hypothetical protein [Enhygromyxa salina]PRP96279.1 hypothetical protein ENSA7_70940 [Enhygromyxa salina]